jgi:hypothetical protein
MNIIANQNDLLGGANAANQHKRNGEFFPPSQCFLHDFRRIVDTD